MAIRDSWAVQASGPTGLLDVEEARVALGALVMPHTSSIKAKSGFRPGPTSPGAVTATGTPDGFVHVAPFQLLLQGGRSSAPGTYLATADAQVDINVLSTPADPTNPRNDLIIAQQSDTFYGDGTSPFQVRQVVGTPAGVPADPTVTGSGDHVTLARVRVDAAATTIVSAKITDLRTTGHAKSLVGGLYSVALGGLLPVASTTERNALTGIYDGMAVWRQDIDRVEVYNGAAFQSISPYAARQILGGATAVVTFASIPSTLRRVVLRWSARSDTAAASTGMNMRVNADAGAVYDYQYTQGLGAVVSAVGATATNQAQVAALVAATSTAGVFSSGEISFTGWDSPHANNLGYLFSSQAMKLNGIGNITQAGGGEYTTAGPYTAIQLYPAAGNFVAGSDFQLEGWE